MASPSEDHLVALFHHLVLPPKLPDCNDDDQHSLRLGFGERVLSACTTLHDSCPRLHGPVWDTLTESLRVARILNQGHLSKPDLLQAFERLAKDGDYEWLVVHVARQNAALLIHRQDDEIIFETFDSAAPAKEVLEANHALTWDFPGRAVSISTDHFDNQSFQNNLADLLDHASVETFDRFAARATKNGKQIVERRDCPSSALISEMLMSLLEGLGNTTSVRIVRKRVRDDVVLGESEVPWRRSAYWLVLRVAIRRILVDMLKDEALARVYFKFLMCAVFSRFLEDSSGKLHPENTIMLQAKLSRRLTKLESETSAASGEALIVYNELFAATRDGFAVILQRSRENVSLAWERYKKTCVRWIPRLPQRADDEDLVLKLPNSGDFLSNLVQQAAFQSRARVKLPISLDEGTVSQVNQLSTRYAKFVDYDAEMAARLRKPSTNPENECQDLAHMLRLYAKMTSDVYNDDALLMSRRLLRLFEMWMHMDGAAIKACPLLAKYHPIFVPQSLDVLCLLTENEMARLSAVQNYLASRIDSHNPSYGSILDDPNTTLSFPLQYVNASNGMDIRRLTSEIDDASSNSRDKKISELENLMEEYNQLSEEIHGYPCTCTHLADGTKDVKGCTRCWKWRCRKRLKISLHEDFLPSEATSTLVAERASIVFELIMPKYLAEYRQTIFQLVLLGTQPTSMPSSQSAPLVLKDFDTIKEVLVTFGPQFSLYDNVNKVWVCDIPKIPWFHHLLGSWLPKSVLDPYRDEALHDTRDKVFRPSSYQIAANAPNSPPGISPREFSAFQRIVSGRRRRWPELLVELGATNLNHSSETAMEFLNHIVLQAGPSGQESDIFRETHGWFRDENFCLKLCEQLNNRLDALASNWRAVQSMSILVTFSLRLYHFCPDHLRPSAGEPIDKIRSITSGWISHLRNHVRSTRDAEVARTAANYAFRAALLCRQTFLHAPAGSDLLDHQGLNFFLRASIALQENILVNFDELSPLSKRLLIHDLHMSYSKRQTIKKWVGSHFSILGDLVNETWVGAGSSNWKSFTPWSFLESPHDWWVTSTTSSTKWAASQVVHYHLIQGHLLVDGKPLGRLPPEIRKDPTIQELFGNQHLLTRPSSLIGSQYQVMNEIERHQIHIGFANGRVCVRAIISNGRLLEHVSRSVFKSPSGAYDLPATLVDDCVHWLNVESGLLEMRKTTRMWDHLQTNWMLDVRTRLCSRNRNLQKSGSSLVELDSKVGQLIAGIFDGFEHANRLTIYQPGNGKLSVEMKRLEIQFTVGLNGLLGCKQLASEIDPSQDIGALHGLTSHVVLRNRKNFNRRSIIVALSEHFSWKRKGFHSAVRIDNRGLYARFTIDNVLGRLDCASEPTLLYFKAALHAFTSFPLPDKLTGRTGTEEALHILTSAESQPWSPVRSIAMSILSQFRSLSPGRQQYPPGTNFYQKVHWDKYLTMTIQHERLAPLAESLMRQSTRLQIFWNDSEADPAADLEDFSMSHLNTRGLIRRQIYARVQDAFDSLVLRQGAESTHYRPGDGTTSTESRRVYRTIKALREASEDLPKRSELKSLLENQDTIGGFNRPINNNNIHEFFDAETAVIWGRIVRLCIEPTSPSEYTVDFSMALAAYRERADMNLIAWLLALMRNSSLCEIALPQYALFTKYQYSEEPRKETLQLLILHNQQTAGRNHRQRGKRSHSSNREYAVNQKLEADKISYLLVAKWPDAPRSATEFTKMTDTLKIENLNRELSWENLEPELQRLLANTELSNYLDELQKTVDRIAIQNPGPDLGAKGISPKSWIGLPSNLTPVNFQVPVLGGELALMDLDSPDEEPLLPTGGNRSLIALKEEDSSLPEEIGILKGIVQSFTTSQNSLRRQYGSDLEESIAKLSQKRLIATSQKRAEPLQIYDSIQMANLSLSKSIGQIRECIQGGNKTLEWLNTAGLLPCLSPIALLELLRNGQSVSPSVMKALVSYGVLITKLQRLLRMDHAAKSYDTRRLQQEQGHEGHSNWSPSDQPEWLLLEIDNDILIRESQVEVALSIISPSSATNSVLQMNMGEGKTSCVMPMAATVLADNINLCRLVVPRALLMQTAQVMQRRIGRLIGRRVQHVPFARRSPKGKNALALYEKIHYDTLDSGGVMLTLPEHILSFRLSGLQQLADKDMETAGRMIDIQRWIDAYSRDVLDESDLMLSPKTQLIYPGGTPVVVDGHPHRWGVVEELLFLVQGHCSVLKSQYGNKIQIIQRHSGFPIIQLLNSKVENALNELLVKDVCEGRISLVQLRNPSSLDAQQNLKLIVSGSDVPRATWKRAAKSLVDKTVGTKSLYLLRGLISQRILLLCLKKRWNVQFGLHPTRPPIAVPFEAKGIPSQTATYGHPDTTLVLTCLAFYQTGLTLSQMTEGLLHVIKSDDPTTQYDHWTQGCTALPVELRQVNILNAEDEAQMEALWKHLRYSTHALNYYMNHFVFPKHAKQFEVKLQASGWDIPSLPRNSEPENNQNLTTGFSGTNDNKRMLPWTIKQHDLPALVHTNAEVLCYLLEERNRTCYQAVDHSGRGLSEPALLRYLHMRSIRILIDAGAHILEMENLDLAKEWLRIDTSAQGAVYFNANGEAMVVARFQRNPVPLLASSFVDDMRECVVYIDEAHTRGTDLKLPIYATGAVTLSMGQSKDQTVQAAMRLRQLGSTQSVAFIAPPEVYQDIIDLQPSGSILKRPGVTSVDVVRWLLEQSCKATEDMNSLHLAQGFDFCRRTDSLWNYEGSAQKSKDAVKLLQAIVQPENQTLEELYGPRDTVPLTEHAQFDSALLREFNTALRQQQLEMHRNATSSQASTMAEVEQEREVEFEVEQIREKQSRMKFSPYTFPGLDPSLVRFVRTGDLELDGPFIQAFAFLGTTAIGLEFGVQETGSNLFVSQEFSKAVMNDNPENGLKVVRPVEWILWSAKTNTAVIVIPEEAELLMPNLHELPEPHVWLLTYAASVTKSMRTFNNLKYFEIPSSTKCQPLPTWLTIEVGLIAGRLYFDYSEYKPLLAWLGEDGSEVSSNGSTAPSGFRIRRPMQFLLEWLTYCRNGQDIMQTPMGFVCQRRALTAGHSFFVSGAGQPLSYEEQQNGAPKQSTSDDLEDSEDDSQIDDD